MFEYDGMLLRFRNTHEWCQAGVTSHVQDLQDAPVTLISWLHRSLIKREAVAIHDVTKLPRRARALQVELLRQDDKSVLSVPIFCKNQLRACIGLDMTRRLRVWSSQEAIALGACAELIGMALYGSAVPKAAGEHGAAPLLYLRQRGSIRGVMLDDILGLRSARDYTRVWLADGSSVLDTRAFGVWLAMLPAANFLRIHRSAIINMKHLSDLARDRDSNVQWSVRLRGVSQPWAVSRSYRQALRTRLGV